MASYLRFTPQRKREYPKEQDFIERALILSPGGVLRPPLAELKEVAVQTPSSEPSTLEEMEREHVQRAVRASNWVIGGPLVEDSAFDDSVLAKI